jgi:hypothetical protein
VAIPADRKVVQKEAEKKFRCRDTMNVEPKMYYYTRYHWSNWNSNEKLKEKPGGYGRKHSTDSLQQTAVLGTSHIIRKVLQCET